MKEYIDASVFLGMHSKNEKIRAACKNYFVKQLNSQVGMSLEQVGKCDDVIWQYQREQQDAYYPFMDNLHTVMNINRIPYNERDVTEAMFNPCLHDLDFSERLILGMALAREGVLYTINPKLVNFKPTKLIDRFGREVAIDPKWFDISDVVRCPQEGNELDFPSELEKFYQQSLKVRI